jgi:hypothetical protein
MKKAAPMDDLEAVAILRAYRRGVAVKEIADTLRIPQGSFAAKVGTWALRRCRCGDRKHS